MQVLPKRPQSHESSQTGQDTPRQARNSSKKLHHSPGQDQTARDRPSTAQHGTKTSPGRLTFQAQRGGMWIEQACHVLGCRLPTSRFTTREAPHRFLCGTPEEAPADYICTTTYVHTYIGFQTEIHFKPRASPQAKLRPGRLPTSRITIREAPHKQNYHQGA